MHKLAIVVPNWNGKDSLAACLDSLLLQTEPAMIIVVENGSIDGSQELLQKHYPHITVLQQPHNLGFAGGVNVGIRHAILEGCQAVALFNNDAVADKDWLRHLAQALRTNSQAGIVTCSFMSIDKKHFDSTGDQYTVWGLPYPRGRGELARGQYDTQTKIFGASGGASLYRVAMLEIIGLFDEDFFAYYEDVDLSFRAQLANWQVRYVPTAVAYHHIGATSGKIKGFTTYQTMKNQPLLLYKNVPTRYLWSVSWRFLLAHSLFFVRAISVGNGWAALKGDAKGTQLLFKKRAERRRIQKNKQVSDYYIWQLMTHDLPPNANALRTLRTKFWRLKGKVV